MNVNEHGRAMSDLIEAYENALASYDNGGSESEVLYNFWKDFKVIMQHHVENLHIGISESKKAAALLIEFDTEAKEHAAGKY